MAAGLVASIREMADATPPARDRYVDFLRALSITVVVVGHYTIALIFWEDGWISIRNAVGVTSGLWLATWLLQVMPIFFVVGGFSNRVSWEAARRRGDGYGEFIRGRLSRLLAPTAVFVVVWTVVQALFHLFDIGAPFGLGGLIRLSMIPFGPLWFLLVYMVVTALTPVTLALHRRAGRAVPAVLVCLVAAADVARFRFGYGAAGWTNLLWVWLLAHQLGYFYDPENRSRLAWWLSAAAGLAGLIVLTNLGWFAASLGYYPRSMLGTDVETVSNMSPPTLCIVALTFWLLGLAMLLRAPLTRWLAGRRPWRAVVAANAFIMTAFLWHLTAYLVAIVVFYPLGLGRPTTTTVSWWLQRPFWIAVPGAILAGMIAVLVRFERPRARRPGAPTPDDAQEPSRGARS